MSRTALVLAAHGSRLHSTVNAEVRRCATRLAASADFNEVAVAFHQGTPSFAEVLDSLDADDVTVVPFMTSEGYYSRVVLPRELAKNPRFAEKSVRITPPVGTHPAIVDLVARRVRDRRAENDLAASATSVAVVGHGTERHRASRMATLDLCDALRRRGLAAEVLPAFLDEAPGVNTILTRAAAANVVVVPFLIGAGPHATRDIPGALGIGRRDAVSLPVVGSVGDRRVVCDAPVGGDPGIIDILGALVLPDTSFDGSYPGPGVHAGRTATRPARHKRRGSGRGTIPATHQFTGNGPLAGATERCVAAGSGEERAG